MLFFQTSGRSSEFYIRGTKCILSISGMYEVIVGL